MTWLGSLSSSIIRCSETVQTYSWAGQCVPDAVILREPARAVVRKCSIKQQRTTQCMITFTLFIFEQFRFRFQRTNHWRQPLPWQRPLYHRTYSLYTRAQTRSGVTRVGVTRGGNWGCHPYFFLKKLTTFLVITVCQCHPYLFCTEKLTTFFAHHCHLYWFHCRTFLPVRPRLSTVLCKFTNKKFFTSGVTRGGPPSPPSDTTADTYTKSEADAWMSLKINTSLIYQVPHVFNQLLKLHRLILLDETALVWL